MVTHKPSETVGSELVNDNVGVMKRSLFFILIAPSFQVMKMPPERSDLRSRGIGLIL